MTLFDDRDRADRPDAPLAVRMRPRTVDEVVGQEAALAEGSPLRSLVTGGVRGAVSVVLWGPPGTGKTTLATLVSRESERVFTELSAVTAGVKDVRAVIDDARERLRLHDLGTVLFVDEVHRFSKSQQDALLPAVENGWVTLIAATTENPSFSVIAPLLSRSIVVTLQPLTDEGLETVIRRAISHERGLADEVSVTDEAIAYLVRVSAGDARRGLTALDAACAAAVGPDASIDLAAVEAAVQHAAVRYDKDGDQHYDVVSAFIKSVRGSDPDAALHYLARMLEAGEDPRFIARRLMILASEDVGLADPTVLVTTTAAAQSVAMIDRSRGARAQVQRGLPWNRGRNCRCEEREHRHGPGAPTGRSLRECSISGARQRLRLSPRCPWRCRRGAVPAAGVAGCEVLPTHRPRGRGEVGGDRLAPSPASGGWIGRRIGCVTCDDLYGPRSVQPEAFGPTARAASGSTRLVTRVWRSPFSRRRSTRPRRRIGSPP